MSKRRIDKSNNQKKKSAFRKALNKFMPYILTVLAAVVLFALSGLAGGFGNGIRYGLYGTFANFATYFFPIFLLYHAIMWNYDVKRKICVRRVVCSIITLLCFSTMQYLIQVGDYEELNSYSVGTFFSLGMESVGGGFVGGIFGKLLLGLGNVIGVIIITLLLVLMILQMFNITPAYMVRSMLKNRKPKKAKKVVPVKAKPEKKIKRTNPKKIEVFDDDDSGEVAPPPPAYLDTTRVVSLDDEDTTSDNYEEFSMDKVHERTEHIPSQLQPYKKEEKQEPEFTVSTSRYDDYSAEEKKEDAVFDDYEEEASDTVAFEPVVEEHFTPYVPEEPYEAEDEAEPYDVEDEPPFEEDEELDFEEFAPEFEDDALEQTDESYISKDLLNKATAKMPERVFEPVIAPVVEKVEKKEEKKVKPKVNYTLPPLYFLKS